MTKYETEDRLFEYSTASNDEELCSRERNGMKRRAMTKLRIHCRRNAPSELFVIWELFYWCFLLQRVFG